jgi:hypothetical protein
VEEETISNTISIYPNPTSDELLIKTWSTLFNEQNYTFTILDINGKICKSSILVPNERIDIHTLTNGLYFIKIQNGDKEFRLKFSKI